MRSTLIYDTILNQCKSGFQQVRVLCLKVETTTDGSWLKLISHFAPSVEVLDIDGVNSAVNELCLDFEFLRVKQLHLYWQETTDEKVIDYARVFKVMGRTIEEMHLRCNLVPTDRKSDLLLDVRQHCPNLRRFSAKCMLNVTRAFAELLIRYGSQLLHVDFDAIRSETEACDAVLESCSNVFGLATTRKGCALDGVAVVVPRLEEWSIVFGQNTVQLSEIAGRCGKLQRLRLCATNSM